MIAIIDYGVGNLFSLECSFNAIGVDTVVTGNAEIIKNADRIILPGVGAFEDAIKKLRATGLDKVVCELAKEGKPIMGICLGMQLLFEKSYEFGEYKGLGLIKGTVEPFDNKIDKALKTPHMGWNSLDIKDENNLLFKYIKNGDSVYFVHSYSAVGCEDSVVATTEYSVPLTAVIAKDNIFGCQFHPEKSGQVGLNILKAFCERG